MLLYLMDDGIIYILGVHLTSTTET